MQKLLLLWIIILLVISIPAHSQCPQPSFTIPDTVCINEPFDIINTSTDAVRYQWDFCSGDLNKEPVGNSITQIVNGNITSDITTVYDGTNWYGFVCSRDNNTIIRLDFGNNIENNNPSAISLTNPGGLLNKPEKIEFSKSGSEWYALAVNIGNSSLVRLNFGNNLNNIIPTAEKISALDGVLNVPRSITLAVDHNSIMALITNNQENTITIVDFGNSLANPITSANVITTSAIPATRSWGLLGISVFKYCEKWYGLAVNSNNDKVHKLEFGTNLFSLPAITDIQIPTGGFVKIETAMEGGRYYTFLMTIEGLIGKLDFGDNILNNPVFKVVLAPGNATNLFGLDLMSTGSRHYLFYLRYDTRALYKLTFPDACSANIAFSESEAPTGIKYSASGNKEYTVAMRDQLGNRHMIQKSIYVRPESFIDFTATKQCTADITQFAGSKQITDKIISWSWDFGDNSTAAGQKVEHHYNNAGIFPVRLTVTDVCGKILTTTKNTIIHENTIPDFLAPSVACSNEAIPFEDKSVFNSDKVSSWRWDFGDGQISSEENPVHTFTEAGTYNVLLTITGISGCSFSVEKSIDINPGAAVNFSEKGLCLDEKVQFINETTFEQGNVVSVVWDFGDGDNSAEKNPIHAYNTPGEYTVKLTVQNNLGCTTAKIRKVNIYKRPEIAYSYSLACSGEDVKFFDESMFTEGSIKTWLWNFGDLESGTDNLSDLQNPLHTFSTPGIYNVKLEVETVHGCKDSLTKTVTVLDSPLASFSYIINCRTKAIDFLDQSVTQPFDSIAGWYWDFGDNTISQDQNPRHMYSQPGTYTVKLITTSTSRCTNYYSKVITLPEDPIANFNFPENKCTENSIQFTDKSTFGNNDFIVSWQWDFGKYGSSTEQHPQINLSSTEDYSLPITLTIHTAAGCTASVTKSIFLQKPIQATFTYQIESTSTPLSIRFKSILNTPVNLIWNFGDNQESRELNPLHNYEKSGVYMVTLTVINAAGCSTVIQQEIVVSNISSEVELKLISLQVDEFGGDKQAKIILVNNSQHTLLELELEVLLDGDNLYTYIWQGELLSGKALKYSFTIPSGSSSVSSLCLRAISHSFNKISNRQCWWQENTFAILNPYPNPADAYILLSFHLPLQGNMEIYFTDILGRTVLSYNIYKEAGFHQLQINRDALPVGMYYISYRYDGRQYVKNIILK